jgi:polyhydroxyalkanoate synthesis regulator protein
MSAAKPDEEAKSKAEPPAGAAAPDEIGELKAQLAAMQAKLEQLSRNRS